VQEHVGVGVEELLDRLGPVGGQVVHDAVQLHAGGGLVDEVLEEGHEVLRAG